MSRAAFAVWKNGSILERLAEVLDWWFQSSCGLSGDGPGRNPRFSLGWVECGRNISMLAKFRPSKPEAAARNVPNHPRELTNEISDRTLEQLAS